VVTLDKHIAIASFITENLDNKFQVGRFKFGLDPLFGLVPVLGNIIPALLSFYIVWIGIRMNLPEKKIQEMVRNIILDLLLGLIPVAGNVLDFVFKANVKNMKIINEYREKVVEGKVIYSPAS
jgi:Domain of unknown function (DUF4112)